MHHTRHITMTDIIVVRIHNMSLGSVTRVLNFDTGVKLISKLFSDQFGRDMNAAERCSLENNYEVTNDDDHENIYAFSIGVLEDDDKI